MSTFQVNTEIYEGPFDLLLELIKKHRVDVCDIPLAAIIGDFISYIRKHAGTMDDLSSFLVIAALLMQIKANALLPKPEDEGEVIEELGGVDPSIVLAASLVEYKKFKNVALELQAKFDFEEKFYSSRVLIEAAKQANINYLEGLSSLDIAGHYLSLLKQQLETVSTDHLVGSVITIEEQIDYVLEIIAKASKKQTTFSELIKECRAKIEVIVTFLALLELHKAGTIKLVQEQSFGEITIIGR